MKAFVVKNVKMEKKYNFKGTKFNNFKFSENNKFNYITISNPIESKIIFVIEHINFNIENCDNEISVFIGEKVVDTDKSFELNCKCEIYHKINKNLEIETIKFTKNEEKQLLHNETLILLPAGCFFIKLKNPVNRFELNINFKEENI